MAFYATPRDYAEPPSCSRRLQRLRIAAHRMSAQQLPPVMPVGFSRAPRRAAAPHITNRRPLMLSRYVEVYTARENVSRRRRFRGRVCDVDVDAR